MNIPVMSALQGRKRASTGVLCSLLVLIAGISRSALAADSTAKPQYTIDAIRYATDADKKVNALVVGADPSRTVDLAMVVWLVRGGGRNILFDSGFYRDKFFHRKFKIVDYTKPTDAVARAGVEPGEITDIVISHAHWDHADGADLFPKARIWIQRDEYTYYTGEAWHSKGNRAMDPEDVLSFVKMNIEGRVSFIEGDAQEIIPGITAYLGGKHTYASQFLGVNTSSGTVVLASDNVYMYENLEKRVPITATLDPAENLRAMDRMRKIAAKESLIVPGHDPEQFNRFKGPMPGIVRIQ